MEDEVRFLYSVNPKKPIKGILENNRPINSAKSLNLTLEQVAECMKCGSVYRWFANENRLERVTTLNMERLHNEKFLTEEEFEAAKFNGVASNTGTVVDTKTEEPTPVVEEVAAPAADEAPVEEVKVEETPVVEEKVEEVVVEEPVVEEAKVEEEVKVEETVTEEAPAEAATEEVVEEAPKTENNNFQANNYKKKKH